MFASDAIMAVLSFMLMMRAKTNMLDIRIDQEVLLKTKTSEERPGIEVSDDKLDRLTKSQL